MYLNYKSSFHRKQLEDIDTEEEEEQDGGTEDLTIGNGAQVPPEWPRAAEKKVSSSGEKGRAFQNCSKATYSIQDSYGISEII